MFSFFAKVYVQIQHLEVLSLCTLSLAVQYGVANSTCYCCSSILFYCNVTFSLSWQSDMHPSKCRQASFICSADTFIGAQSAGALTLIFQIFCDIVEFSFLWFFYDELPANQASHCFRCLLWLDFTQSHTNAQKSLWKEQAEGDCRGPENGAAWLKDTQLSRGLFVQSEHTFRAATNHYFCNQLICWLFSQLIVLVYKKLKSCEKTSMTGSLRPRRQHECVLSTVWNLKIFSLL